MEEKCSQKIKIQCGTDTKNIIVKNGKLKKSVLQDYFCKEGNVTYKIGEEDFLLETDNCNIYLEPTVDLYFFNETKADIPLEMGSKKRKSI